MTMKFEDIVKTTTGWAIEDQGIVLVRSVSDSRIESLKLAAYFKGLILFYHCEDAKYGCADEMLEKVFPDGRFVQVEVKVIEDV